MITALAGGIGGARFIAGVKEWLSRNGRTDDITVVANTADDIRMFGLQVCPDLDTLMYTLGGGISKERGWGREDESWHAKEELAAYQFGPDWFGLGDRDIATHLVRTSMLDAGYSLSQVTEALCARWNPGVRLLPMSDDRVETHVVISDDQGHRAIHFQEWWVRYRATVDAHEFRIVGAKQATPAPDVITSILEAEIVLLPPSNPVVSIGTILQIPGIKEALQATSAPVVAVSPIVANKAVRGMADQCLKAIGVKTTAAAVAAHYGPRKDGGLIDAWIMDTSDSEHEPFVKSLGITTHIRPAMMDDLEMSCALAGAALELAQSMR